MASNLIHLSIFAFFPTLMALSASMDLLTFTIPNRICVALALGYVIFAALLGVPAVSILLNISCGLAILLIAFGMFSFGWLGVQTPSRTIPRFCQIYAGGQETAQ